MKKFLDINNTLAPPLGVRIYDVMNGGHLVNEEDSPHYQKFKSWLVEAVPEVVELDAIRTTSPKEFSMIYVPRKRIYDAVWAAMYSIFEYDNHEDMILMRIPGIFFRDVVVKSNAQFDSLYYPVPNGHKITTFLEQLWYFITAVPRLYKALESMLFKQKRKRLDLPSTDDGDSSERNKKRRRVVAKKALALLSNGEETLPPELLVMIGSYLTLRDALRLALRSRSGFDAIGVTGLVLRRNFIDMTRDTEARIIKAPLAAEYTAILSSFYDEIDAVEEAPVDVTAFMRWFSRNMADRPFLIYDNPANVSLDGDDAKQLVDLVHGSIMRLVSATDHTITFYYYSIGYAAASPLQSMHHVYPDNVAPVIIGQNGLILRLLENIELVFDESVPEETQKLWAPLVQKANDAVLPGHKHVHFRPALARFFAKGLMQLDESLCIYYRRDMIIQTYLGIDTYVITLPPMFPTWKPVKVTPNVIAAGLKYGPRHALMHIPGYGNDSLQNGGNRRRIDISDGETIATVIHAGPPPRE
jgi:hypothetical protein